MRQRDVSMACKMKRTGGDIRNGGAHKSVSLSTPTSFLPAASSTGAPLTFLASIRRSASLCRCGEKREHEHEMVWARQECRCCACERAQAGAGSAPEGLAFAEGDYISHHSLRQTRQDPWAQRVSATDSFLGKKARVRATAPQRSAPPAPDAAQRRRR